jgi:hypothetical protein
LKSEHIIKRKKCCSVLQWVPGVGSGNDNGALACSDRLALSIIELDAVWLSFWHQRRCSKLRNLLPFDNHSPTAICPVSFFIFIFILTVGVGEASRHCNRTGKIYCAVGPTQSTTLGFKISCQRSHLFNLCSSGFESKTELISILSW